MPLEDFYDLPAERPTNPGYYAEPTIYCTNCGALYPGYLTPEWHRRNGKGSYRN